MTTSAMIDELLVEHQGTTRVLTLNRPDKMNALSASLVDALIAELQSATAAGVRLVVFKGAGRNFSAGFDFGGFEDQSEGDLLLRFTRIEQLLAMVYHAPFDTLALAHGRNFGAGVDLICSCGRRVADPKASFMMPGLGFGIVLGTRRYAERVGGTRARIVLEEGITFSAAEALADGFLSAEVPSESWDETTASAVKASIRLASETGIALNAAVVRDTRSQDLADLVTSAARPGLKERIRAYRAAQAKPSEKVK